MSRTDAGIVEPGHKMAPRRGLRKDFGSSGFEASPTRVPLNPYLLRHRIKVESAALMRFCIMPDELRDPAAPECSGANSNAGVDKIRAFLARLSSVLCPATRSCCNSATWALNLQFSSGPGRPSVFVEGD